MAAALAGATLTLTDRESVTLASSEVRVRDVAIADPALGRLVIARLPAGRREIVLSRRAIASLIRRALPGVAVAGGDRLGSVTLSALIKHSPRIVRRTAAPSDRPTVETGDTLTLVSRAGPVTIERMVTAMQSGRSGRRLFVRDSAGHVSSIPLVGAAAR